MSNRYKKYKPPFDKRNRAGERICVMCGKSLTGRQQRWCGDSSCTQKQFIRSGDQSEMRRFLKDSEKEICQGCGMDCGILDNVVEWVLGNHKADFHRHSCYASTVLGRLKDLGVPIKVTGGSNFVTWEADHIIPLAEGGTHHEDNIQTLCVSCHKGETKKLHGRLAEKKKPFHQMTLDEIPAT